MKKSAGLIAFSLAFVIASYLLANAIINRNSTEDTIWVKGLGKTDFTSDLIVWTGSFSRLDMDLQSAYQQLDSDRKILKEYFQTQGIPASSIVFKAVDINKEYNYTYDQKGNSSRTFGGYRLYQEVKVESKEVDKIEMLSRQVTDLINKGVEFSSQQPQYYYTGLADLKLEMIAAATEDARLRAEQIASNANARIGHLKNARMGVFQITAQNSNEDYSWGGSYNTWSKKKTASITMTLEYEVD
jgi:hypothetical protein